MKSWNACGDLAKKQGEMKLDYTKEHIRCPLTLSSSQLLP